MLEIKRTYDPAGHGDGRRILVERLWPRGMKKRTVAADAWLKDAASSTRLRQWFSHRRERWEEFRRRYQSELDATGPWSYGLSAGATGRALRHPEAGSASAHVEGDERNEVGHDAAHW